MRSRIGSEFHTPAIVTPWGIIFFSPTPLKTIGLFVKRCGAKAVEMPAATKSEGAMYAVAFNPTAAQEWQRHIDRMTAQQAARLSHIEAEQTYLEAGGYWPQEVA